MAVITDSVYCLECCCTEELNGCSAIFGATTDFCGVLTQVCGLGWEDTGQRVVVRTYNFLNNSITCKALILTLSYNFGFASDSVDFYAIIKNQDGSTQETSIGSTGCVNSTGTATFVLPKFSIAIKTVSTFSCLSSQSGLNSSIDSFSITCSNL